MNDELQQLKQRLTALEAEVTILKLSQASRAWRHLRAGRRAIMAFVLCFAAIPLAVNAFTTPNTFIAGTPVVAADVNANFTAIKNQFDAMENKSWRLIHESDVGTATAAINVTGLNGNVDKTYLVIARFVNGTGSAANYYVQPNGDAGTNYGQQYIDGSGTGTPSKGNPGANTTTGLHTCTAAAGTSCEAQATLFGVPGFARVLFANEVYNVTPGAVGGLQLIANSWNNTAANITSLNIMTLTANGIGVGSHIEVWARR